MTQPFEDVAAAAVGLDVSGLRRLGRSLRTVVSRRSVAHWSPLPGRIDPVDQLRASGRDRLPAIAPIRLGRMAVDPFAFLRGAAGIMAGDTGPGPQTGIGVQACGDAHLMNFGLFATTERHLVFDLNDFDETHPGAWEWDVQRLSVSLVMAARVHGFGEDVAADAARSAVGAYRRRMDEMSEFSALERRYLSIDIDSVLDTIRSTKGRVAKMSAVEKQVAKARSRDRFQALGRFTEMRDGRWAIISNPPLIQPLEPDEVREDLVTLYDSYRSALPNHVVRLLDEYEFVDIALKVVGVGSVGTRAFMVLLAGRTDQDPLFLQIKEASASVLAPYAPGVHTPHHQASESRRVVDGQRLMQAAGDMFLGWGEAGGRHFYVRQLRDMKGSVDLTTIHGVGLIRYGEFCGTALAQAHARSQHPALISGYLGRSERFDVAMAAFGAAYADQTERDHQALATAIAAGTVQAISGQ